MQKQKQEEEGLLLLVVLLLLLSVCLLVCRLSWTVSVYVGYGYCRPLSLHPRGLESCGCFFPPDFIFVMQACVSPRCRRDVAAMYTAFLLLHLLNGRTQELEDRSIGGQTKGLRGTSRRGKERTG